MIDLLVIKRVKEGDIKAFEELFRRFYEPLCLYSGKIVKDMNDAEEIVQQLFYTLWRDRDKIRIMLSVKSYLYGAVRNQSLQYIEHKQVRQHHHVIISKSNIDNEANTPIDQLEYKELEKQMIVALNRLPARRREIFCMSRFDGKKYSEIACELSLSVKTVEAEISKALQTMRQTMKYES